MKVSLYLRLKEIIITIFLYSYCPCVLWLDVLMPLNMCSLDQAMASQNISLNMISGCICEEISGAG